MSGNGKIKNLEELIEFFTRFRRENPGKKVVHCHGVFDLIHIGHIRYLEQAKKLGDILVVTLTQDRYVNKGPHRPAFTDVLRAEVLAALGCVDYVAVNKWPTAEKTIKLLKPDIYAKGAEYKDNRTEEISKEEAAAKLAGSKIEFIEDITSSSSHLINNYLELFSEETRVYLKNFSRKYSEGEILSYLESLRSLKVLVVGDTIIDEYQYCDAIGKSSKEPTLVAKYLSTELFAGGSLAVGNHVAGFCQQVGLMTFLGSKNSRKDFVCRNLKPNIEGLFFYKENAPTIVKRRFVDNYFLTKFFEIYVIDDRDLNQDENQKFCQKLKHLLPGYDLVIVADFGHGMLTKDAIDILCNEAKFLAVNTQANAGNRGFNTISKYSRADFISLNQAEVRLETRDRQGDIRKSILDLSQRLSCERILVTQGSYGNLCYSKDEGFFEVPALATRVLDRIGTGDAVLSLTSLCAARQIPMEIIGFIANVIGAEALATMGNRTSVEYKSLSRHVMSLLR